MHRCLEMGARVLRLANATVDTQVVEHRFDQMTRLLDRSVDELARRIDDSARALLDEENGELTAALQTLARRTSPMLLGATFDETSKKSAIAKLEKLLETARREQVAAVRRLLDPDNDESPLDRWRTEIVARGPRPRRGDRAAPQRPELPPRPRPGRGRDDRWHDRGQGIRLRGRRLRERSRRSSTPLQDVPPRSATRSAPRRQGRRHRRRHRPVLREGRGPVRRRVQGPLAAAQEGARRARRRDREPRRRGRRDGLLEPGRRARARSPSSGSTGARSSCSTRTSSTRTRCGSRISGPAGSPRATPRPRATASTSTACSPLIEGAARSAQDRVRGAREPHPGEEGDRPGRPPARLASSPTCSPRSTSSRALVDAVS